MDRITSRVGQVSLEGRVRSTVVPEGYLTWIACPSTDLADDVEHVLRVGFHLNGRSISEALGEEILRRNQHPWGACDPFTELLADR